MLCRGTCSKGHVVEANSDPGRVTWTGPCPECGQKTFARRATGAHTATPRVVEAAKTTEPAEPAKPAKKATHSRVKVDDWSDPNDDPKPATRRRAAATRAKTGHASKATGSSPKPPGRGKPGAGDPPDTGATPDPADTNAGGAEGGTGGAPETEGARPASRGRRIVSRAASFARAERDDSIFDGIY